MTEAASHPKFVFETVFDGAGQVIAQPPPRPRKAIPAEEVDALVEAARRQGEASAVAQAEQAAAATLQQMAMALQDALSTLVEVAHNHRAGAAELALAAARKIADAALEAFPEAPAVAALHALAVEVEGSPRLTITVAPDLAERMQTALDQAASSVGFGGHVQVRPQDGLPAAAFTFDWGDGRAAFDPHSAAARVGEALTAALAAEGLHAEPLGRAPMTSEG